MSIPNIPLEGVLTKSDASRTALNFRNVPSGRFGRPLAHLLEEGTEQIEAFFAQDAADHFEFPSEGIALQDIVGRTQGAQALVPGAADDPGNAPVDDRPRAHGAW